MFLKGCGLYKNPFFYTSCKCHYVSFFNVNYVKMKIKTRSNERKQIQRSKDERFLVMCLNQAMSTSFISLFLSP